MTIKEKIEETVLIWMLVNQLS